jgi:elongation factor G
MAFEQALAQASPTLLEPVMDFEIQVPADFLPGVNADLNSRRARCARWPPSPSRP